MTTVSIIIVLLSGLFHALRDFLNKRADNKALFMWWYIAWAQVLPLPIYWHYLSKETITGIVLGVAFISGVVHVLYRIFLAKSLEYGDFSHVYPIARSAPAPVLLFSIIFLGEKVSFEGVVGILLITLGVYTINSKALSWSEFSSPMSSIFKDKASFYALLTLLSVAGYSIIDKKGTELLHPLSFFFLMELFTFILFSFYLWQKGAMISLMSEMKKHPIAIPLSSILMVASYAFILIAFTMSNVSYVVGLRQVSVIFAVLLGSLFFKERHTKIRLFSSMLIFIGAYFITIA